MSKPTRYGEWNLAVRALYDKGPTAIPELLQISNSSSDLSERMHAIDALAELSPKFAESLGKGIRQKLGSDLSGLVPSLLDMLDKAETDEQRAEIEALLANMPTPNTKA